MSIANTGYKRLTQNDEIIPHKFAQLGRTVIIAIDKDLVKRFNITEDDWAYQYATQNGIHIVFSSKNKVDQKLPSNQPTNGGGYE